MQWVGSSLVEIQFRQRNTEENKSAPTEISHTGSHFGFHLKDLALNLLCFGIDDFQSPQIIHDLGPHITFFVGISSIFFLRGPTRPGAGSHGHDIGRLNVGKTQFRFSI